MDLSIIVPVHNLENYIQPLLSTIWNQNTDGLKIELIFVFDSCTDKSMNVVEEWKDKLLKNNSKNTSFDFKLLTCDYKNCGLARNDGINVATGEYIWFIDGDDWILGSNAFKMLIEAMRNNQLRILRFGYMSLYDVDNWCMVWQYIYRRDLIGEDRFVGIEPDEDVEFNRKVLSKIDYKPPRTESKFYFYNYQRNGSNMTNFYNKK